MFCFKILIYAFMSLCFISLSLLNTPVLNTVINIIYYLLYPRFLGSNVPCTILQDTFQHTKIHIDAQTYTYINYLILLIFFPLWVVLLHISNSATDIFVCVLSWYILMVSPTYMMTWFKWLFCTLKPCYHTQELDELIYWTSWCYLNFLEWKLLLEFINYVHKI